MDLFNKIYISLSLAFSFQLIHPPLPGFPPSASLPILPHNPLQPPPTSNLIPPIKPFPHRILFPHRVSSFLPLPRAPHRALCIETPIPFPVFIQYPLTALPQNFMRRICKSPRAFLSPPGNSVTELRIAFISTYMAARLEPLFPTSTTYRLGLLQGVPGVKSSEKVSFGGLEFFCSGLGALKVVTK